MIRHILVPAAPLVQAPLARRRDHEKLRYLNAGKCRQVILPPAHRYLKLGKGVFPFFLPCIFFPDIPLHFCQFLRIYKANPPLFGENPAGKRLPIPIRYLSAFFQSKGILKHSILIASPKQVLYHCTAGRLILYFHPVGITPLIIADKRI